MTRPSLLELAAPTLALEEPPAELLFHRNHSVRHVLREAWRARELVRTITERNLRVRYKQAVFGVAWAFLQPVSLLAAFTILHRATNISTDTNNVPYLLYAYIGLLAWTFFSTSVISSASAVLGDLVLLNKTYFPREVLPLASVGVSAVNSLIASSLLAVLFGVEGFAPKSTTPLVIIPIVMLVLFTVGICLTLSALTVYARDVRLGLPTFLQFGVFATPIAYSFSRIPHRLRLPYSLINPLGPIIDAVRRTVLLGQQPNWFLLGAAALTCVVTFVVGYVLFKRLETNFADIG